MTLDVAELTDFEALWLTLYGEARGEPVEGQIGVANVIRNRHEESGKSIHDICLAPKQFSCWNMDDPNRPLLIELATADMMNQPLKDPLLRQLKYIAAGIISGDILDNTKNSNHYLTTALYRSLDCPLWAKKGQLMITLGRQTFLWSA